LIQIARLGILVLFVALGLRVARVHEPRRRRRAIQLFLAYTLWVNVLIALRQTDAWPFSPYRMMAVDATVHDDERRMIAFKGVDAGGREWDVDALSWSPLYPQSVMGWFEVGYPQASRAQKDEALRFLLERAREAQAAYAAGRGFGHRRLLGPLTAPDTFVYPDTSRSPQPFAALRIYRVTWRPSALRRDPASASWRLVDEYPRR
jgi:hypothetical protein